jgi:hypothetical protein
MEHLIHFIINTNPSHPPTDGFVSGSLGGDVEKEYELSKPLEAKFG